MNPVDYYTAIRAYKLDDLLSAMLAHRGVAWAMELLLEELNRRMRERPLHTKEVNTYWESARLK